ncbi:MAG TPA: MBL fold metallo-hydrolase, partial [Anaerolineae bacterium]|nr:MBL fold metallo-hydrolase [Anaerolineae bacterium]
GSVGDEGAYGVVLGVAEAGGTEVVVMEAGTAIDMGDGVRLEVVHPAEGVRRDDRNDNSVAMRLVYGELSLLLPGDAEAWGEGQMVDSGYQLQAQVLKVGHHGSATSTTADFLEAVQPQIGIVSSGADNRFGHPAEEVMARLAEAGVAVLRTDEQGTIELVSDGTHMWWFGE